MTCTFFSKDFADPFLQKVQQSKPITPPPDPVTGQRIRTANHMPSLASVFFAAASCKERCKFRDKSVIVESPPVITDEERERVCWLHFADLHSVLDFQSGVAYTVWPGQHLPCWEATITGWIDEESKETC